MRTDLIPLEMERQLWVLSEVLQIKKETVWSRQKEKLEPETVAFLFCFYPCFDRIFGFSFLFLFFSFFFVTRRCGGRWAWPQPTPAPRAGAAVLVDGPHIDVALPR